MTNAVVKAFQQVRSQANEALSRKFGEPTRLGVEVDGDKVKLKVICDAYTENSRAPKGREKEWAQARMNDAMDTMRAYDVYGLTPGSVQLNKNDLRHPVQRVDLSTQG